MISKAGFNQRNVTIVAFAGNCVAVVFVASIILSLVLPKDMDIKKIK